MTETHRLEYKSSLTPELDIEKEVIAFLNSSEGGVIFIGVQDNGRTLGLSDPDGDMLKLKDRIKNNIVPSAIGLYDLIMDSDNGNHFIKIIVAGGYEKPYFKKKFGMTEKGAYMRVGTSTEPMPQSIIDRLYAGRTRNSIGRIKSPNQTPTFEQLRIYYLVQGKALNDNLGKTLELLTEEGDWNYAGYLLSDENGISVKLAVYAGTSRAELIENNEYGYCSLVKAIKSILSKLEVENKITSYITPDARKDIPMWNPIALREAVINAFVHCDYTLESPPKLKYSQTVSR